MTQIIGTWSVVATTTAQSGGFTQPPSITTTYAFTSSCPSSCTIELQEDGAESIPVSYSGGTYHAEVAQILQCPGSPRIGLRFDTSYVVTPTAGHAVGGQYEATAFTGSSDSEVTVASGAPTADCTAAQLIESLSGTRVS